jgi:hypothetical protein
MAWGYHNPIKISFISPRRDLTTMAHSDHQEKMREDPTLPFTKNTLCGVGSIRYVVGQHIL